jgi:NTE family protein
MLQALTARGVEPDLLAAIWQRLRRIREHVAFERLKDSTIPLRVVATDVASGQEVLLRDGDAVDAILASAAIPAVFPSVHISGRDLIDGGVADNAAVSQAVMLGADVVYVLPTGYACALDKPPAAPLSSALQALTLLIEQRLILEVAHFADFVDIRVLPPLCPLTVSSTDFRHGADDGGPQPW